MASPNPRSPKTYTKNKETGQTNPSRALVRQAQADLSRMAGRKDVPEDAPGFDPNYSQNDKLGLDAPREKLRRTFVDSHKKLMSMLFGGDQK